MRVAVADDSALFRAGLVSLLGDAGIDVVIEAREPTALLEQLTATAVDVAIVDIRMPPTFTDEGVRLAETLRHRHPSLAVLVLSTYEQTDYAIRLLQAGEHRCGYLLKDRVDDVAALVDALHRLLRGESVVDARIVARLMRRTRQANEIEELTDRERDILRLMAEGRSNAGIGGELYVSPKTVEAHAAAVFRKLGLLAESASNRRVLAVLTWLRANGTEPGEG